MSAGFQALTEKEKQTLRLIVQGHDAKSTARQLGLSVHTINERLRDARRKLEVSSSREAARLLLNTEREDPKKPGDKQIGEAAPPRSMTSGDVPVAGQVSASGATSRIWLVAGVIIMSVFVGMLALAALSQASDSAASADPPAAISTVDASAQSAARGWLALQDEGRWRDSWAAAAKSFRKLNSLERFTAVAQKVRAPLGAVTSRVAISQERVPAPPAGVYVVKFRTSFVNKADAVETVSLAREAGVWRVVGVLIN